MGEQADALSERLVGSLIGAAEIMNVYLGDRLGLYAPLADGWLTSKRAFRPRRLAERYAREWVEEQAVAGFIDVEDRAASTADRRYRFPRSTPRSCSTGMRRRTSPRTRGCSSRPRNSCRR